jgi:hypothetical protein
MTVDVYELYHQAQRHLADRYAIAAIPLLQLAAGLDPAYSASCTAWGGGSDSMATGLEP